MARRDQGAGVRGTARPRTSGAAGYLEPVVPVSFSDVSRQGVLLIGFFLFGIARSWQLVGARDISLTSTVAAVIRRSARESLRREEGGPADNVGPAGQDGPG